MRASFPLPILYIALGGFAAAAVHDTYKLEDVPLPKDIPAEVGGLGFDEKGRLFVALRRSDVFVAEPAEDPADFKWSRFASGLHNACGLHVVNGREIVVSQMAELTRIKDIDGDGTADTYETLAPLALSGNYHETTALTPDGAGGYFLCPGTSSHNGPTFFQVTGNYSPVGRRGRNFSSVQWRGWILHYTANGGLEPYASGFRMHNGIYRDPDNNLWCGDNQGDWVSTTPFYHVEQGNFYGHVSSLVWDQKWPAGKDPLEMSKAEYNQLRTLPAVLIPYEEINRSASEPVMIPRDGSFGPYAGQMILPDNNGRRLTRLILEKIGDTWQGACLHFIKDDGMRSGNNRAVFSPDGGTLYIGQTTRGWAALAEGVQRLSWTGQTPYDLEKITLTQSGFRLTFTGNIADPAIVAVRRFRYENTANYGGDMKDVGEVAVTAVKRFEKRAADLQLEKLEAGWVYEISIGGLKSAAGKEPYNSKVYYTVNRLR